MQLELQGYAVCWHDLARVERGLPESLAVRCFVEPVVAHLTFAHNPAEVYARTSNGLRLRQDDHGVRVQAPCGLDWEWRQLVAAVRAGTRGMSFIFMPIEEDGGLVRKARLREITITDRPCYLSGAVWLSDEEDLPPRLAALRQRWHANATVTAHDTSINLAAHRGGDNSIGQTARQSMALNLGGHR